MEVKISGMSCGHCKNRVEQALKELGATNISIDLSSGTATFEGVTDKDKIVEAIEDAGYDIEFI